MEKILKIPTNDNHIIYGTLNSFDKKKDKLIIFVHGLSGNQHEHQYFNAVPFFCSRNFDTFRFDFYPKAKNARQSSQSSISTHISDLNTIISFFDKKYKKIYLIGHSLGCIVIMNANLNNIDKIIYWDPTYGFKSLEEKQITYNKNLDKYILHWGWESIISKEFLEEWQESYDVRNYSKRLTKNCRFVFAEKSSKYLIWKDYIKNYKYSIITNASHRFIEEGTLNKLFEESLKML